MIVRTPAERATPQAMASYGILKHPSSSDRNDEKKSSMADMSGFLPLDATGILQLCNGRINSHVPERGWLWLHESGTYVKFTDSGSIMFA
jgi:hypothetical protein